MPFDVYARYKRLIVQPSEKAFTSRGLSVSRPRTGVSTFKQSRLSTTATRDLKNKHSESTKQLETPYNQYDYKNAFIVTSNTFELEKKIEESKNQTTIPQG